jgi:single-strand DNA-binding protein|nr:single-stranded DNA-binding protein [Bacteroides intestinalis]DAY76952.1 MAG TPA: Single strand binding protein [Caudoviricetes sp.]
MNRITLIGNVGKEPEIRTLENGVKVAVFTLATKDRAFTLPDGTQVPERTEWHNLVLRKGYAETAENYIHKGDKLYVEGKSRTRSYEGKKGEKHYITEVHVEGIEMLTPKQQTSSVSPSQEHILPWEREDIVLPNP